MKRAPDPGELPNLRRPVLSQSADQFVACCCPIQFVKAMGAAASLVFCVSQLGNIGIGSSPHINVSRGWGW